MDRKGYALVLAMTMALVLVILVGAFSLHIFFSIQNNIRYINTTKALYLATSGIRYGMFKDSGGTFSITPENIPISVSYQSDDINIIEADVTYKNSSRRIRCEELNNELVKMFGITDRIVKWEE